MLKDNEKIKNAIKEKNKDKKQFLRCCAKRSKSERKGEVLCSVNLIKGITDCNEDNIKFLENLLKLQDSNKIFDNKKLKILIDYKWKSYVRRYYLKEFLYFIFFFLLYIINFIYIYPNRSNEINNSQSIVSIIFDFADLLYFVSYTFVEFHQMKTNLTGYFQSFWNIIDVLLMIGVSLTTILDLIAIFGKEIDLFSFKIITSIVLLIFWIRLLSFSKGFQGTGFLVRLVQQVIIDMRYFLIMIFLVMLAFTSSGYMLQNDYDSGQFLVFNMIYRLMLGDYGNYDHFVSDNFSIPLWIGMIFFTIFMSIIMLNLLISIIGSTFDSVLASEKSMRNIEMLGVIYEVDRYKIMGKKIQKEMRQNQVIGDYLICFHNLSHFKEEQKNDEHLLNDMHVLNKKVESIDNYLQEKLEKKIEETLEKKIQEKFEKMQEKFEKMQEKMQEKIIEKIQEKNQKIVKNLE